MQITRQPALRLRWFFGIDLAGHFLDVGFLDQLIQLLFVDAGLHLPVGDAAPRTPRVIDQGIISTQERSIMIKKTIAALCSWP